MTRAIVRVRPATATDIPAIRALLQTVELRGLAGRAAADPGLITARLTQLVDSDEHFLLVAGDDADEVAGVLIARIDAIGALDLTPVLHVSHLLVVPGQRRRGAARSLLSAAVGLAEDRGAEHLIATVAAGSREGNRYLARIGFAPLVVARLAPVAVLRRTLGLHDGAGRTAVLRRARMVRAQRGGFGARTVTRGA